MTQEGVSRAKARDPDTLTGGAEGGAGDPSHASGEGKACSQTPLRGRQATGKFSIRSRSVLRESSLCHVSPIFGFPPPRS